ncbi:MAG: hypothetical protein ACKO9A_10025 [Alphaproteobacteria bacterium]
MSLAETPFLIEENRRLHRFLLEGVPIEVRRADERFMSWRTISGDEKTPKHSA